MRRGLESSPPLVTAEGIKPLPPTGARKVDLRTLFFYGYTGITPAMCMRLTNIGPPPKIHGTRDILLGLGWSSLSGVAVMRSPCWSGGGCTSR